MSLFTDDYWCLITCVVWTGTVRCGWHHWSVATLSLACVDAEGGHFENKLGQ